MSKLSIGLAATAFCFLASPLVAQETVLGLPTPDHPQRPGTVVLHGGGAITNEVFWRFVELAGGPSARIVFVPCAGYRRGWYASDEELLDALDYRFNSWASLADRGRVRSFDFLFTDDPSDAEDADFVRPLENATGVWFCGGWQERLNYRFVGEFPQQTRFQRALINVVKRGGIVGGTSAGMAIMPEVITINERRDSSDSQATVVAAHGFGLIKGAIVEQHFETRGGRLERFTGLLRDNERLDYLSGRRGTGARMIGLAVEEDAGLFLRGDRLEVLSGVAHVFIKSNTGRTIAWHELQPGETAQLRRGVATPTTLALEQNQLTR